MNAEQQRFLLASYGPDWQTADLLLGAEDAVARAKAGVRGGSMEWDGQRTYFQTNGRGIGVGSLHAGVRVVIPWAAFGEHRKTLPTTSLERLRVAREARHNEERYPVFHVPTEINERRVGPNQDIHHDDREALHAAHLAWFRDVEEPWRAERARIDSELATAIRACLPLANDTSPVDLLDHLAAMEAHS